MYWSDSGKFEPNPTLMALFQRAHEDKMSELSAIRAAQEAQAQAGLLNAQSAAALRPSQSVENLARADAYRAQAQYAIPAQGSESYARANVWQAQANEANAKNNAALQPYYKQISDIADLWNKTHGQNPPNGIGQQVTLANPQQPTGSLFPSFDLFDNYKLPSAANLQQNLFNEDNTSTVNNDKQALPSNIGIPGIQRINQNNGVPLYTNNT
jgi:hypothetical protein